jgi:hypothetical protein
MTWHDKSKHRFHRLREFAQMDSNDIALTLWECLYWERGGGDWAGAWGGGECWGGN